MRRVLLAEGGELGAVVEERASGKSCGSSCLGALARVWHEPTDGERVRAVDSGELRHMTAKTRERTEALMLGPHERPRCLSLVMVKCWVHPISSTEKVPVDLDGMHGHWWSYV